MYPLRIEQTTRFSSQTVDTGDEKVNGNILRYIQDDYIFYWDEFSMPPLVEPIVARQKYLST